MTGEVKTGDGRRAAQQAIVRAALAGGASYREAGDEGDVAERTVARWMSDSVFRRSVSEARAEHVSVVTGRLNALAATAAEVLREALSAQEWPIRLRAAQLTLSWSARLRSDVELEARLSDVEERLGLTDASSGGSE